MHVSVVHPAWLAFVPPRSRTPREVLVQHVTPAEIRRYPEGTFEPAFALPGKRPFDPVAAVMHGPGGLWEEVRMERGQPVHPEALRWFLVGHDCHGATQEAVAARFVGTPARAAGPGGRVSGAGELGAPPAPRGEILRDGRSAASAELLRFLERDVAIVESRAGSRLLVRCRPVALSGYAVRRDPSITTESGKPWHLALRRGDHAWTAFAAGPGLAEGTFGLRARSPRHEIDGLEAWIAACERHPDPDADLVHLLNLHAGRITDVLNRTILAAAADGVAQDWLLRRRDDLAPVARRALLGLAGTVDLAREAEALCDAARALVLTGYQGSVPAGVHHLSRALDAHVRPRAEAMLGAPLDAEDEAAIGALAP